MSVLAADGSLSLEAKWKKVWSRAISRGLVIYAQHAAEY